jgi:hypothetical protein
VVDLRLVTADMLDAARKVEATRLASLAESRAELTFELRIALQSPPDQDLDRGRMREEVYALRELERRVARVGSIVLHALDKVTPRGRVSTYGRRGAVQGG